MLLEVALLLEADTARFTAEWSFEIVNIEMKSQLRVFVERLGTNRTDGLFFGCYERIGCLGGRVWRRFK